MIGLADPVAGAAVLSPCGAFRYLLTRRLGAGTKLATFVMLNPSTADADRDDATIPKCVGFARRWGCAGLQVVNLFAFRATDPADMRKADDPVGPENAAWIGRAIREAGSGPVVCAWGYHGAYRGQDLVILRLLKTWRVAPVALQVTKHGQPKHPLYVPYGAQPIIHLVRCHVNQLRHPFPGRPQQSEAGSEARCSVRPWRFGAKPPPGHDTIGRGG